MAGPKEIHRKNKRKNWSKKLDLFNMLKQIKEILISQTEKNLPKQHRKIYYVDSRQSQKAAQAFQRKKCWKANF